MTCRYCEGVGVTRSMESGMEVVRDAPTCAFKVQNFSSENWNCGTMNLLRDLASDHEHSYSDDQTATQMPVAEGQFLILGWYKSRGRVEFAGVLSEETIRTLTLECAYDILKQEGWA